MNTASPVRSSATVAAIAAAICLIISTVISLAFYHRPVWDAGAELALALVTFVVAAAISFAIWRAAAQPRRA